MKKVIVTIIFISTALAGCNKDETQPQSQPQNDGNLKPGQVQEYQKSAADHSKY